MMKGKLTKVIAINKTVSTLQALRPQIRIALQYAARNPLIRTRVEQIHEWAEKISKNLGIDLDEIEIKNRLIPKDALNLECGFDMNCVTHRHSAYSETMRFLSTMTSINSPHLPRPKDRDRFMVLAKKVCEAFYSVVAGSRSGLVTSHRLIAAQNTILEAFNEMRQQP